MGQARLRQQKQRQVALNKSAERDFPTSKWEVDVCAELREEDVILVSRDSLEKLTWMRMLPNECHQNVNWYVANDLLKNLRAVTGWWVQWPNFVLHSVLEINSALVCITPSHFGEQKIPFIPDDKIEWIEEDRWFRAMKYGQFIGSGVRRYPDFTMAQNTLIRDRLIAGIDLHKASYFSDEEIEKLKIRYTD